MAKLVAATEGVERAAELFLVRNYYALEGAILDMCGMQSEKPKAGLMVALGTLIRNASKTVVVDHIVKNKLEEVKEVERFQKVFNLNYAKMFSTAEYQLKEKRQRDNRKPAALPDEKSLETLRRYLIAEINRATARKAAMSRADYVHLRKVVLTRLTLLNARRGSEPARLLIKDFEDRNSWIEEGTATNLSNNYTIMFVMGKGAGLVPVVVPKDCERALELLVNSKNRSVAGVNQTNKFLFAYTKDSTDNITGYNEIMQICRKINIPVITATAIRHRSSTIFWHMEGIDEQKVNRFMEHMGHSKDINKNIYAVPPVLSIMQTVVPVIERLDTVCSLYR